MHADERGGWSCSRGHTGSHQPRRPLSGFISRHAPHACTTVNNKTRWHTGTLTLTLAKQRTLVVHTYGNILQWTQDGVDQFLSERLDGSWEQDKMSPLVPSYPASSSPEGPAHEGAAHQSGEVQQQSQLLLPMTPGRTVAGSASSQWLGRPAELALQVSPSRYCVLTHEL